MAARKLDSINGFKTEITVNPDTNNASTPVKQPEQQNGNSGSALALTDEQKAQMVADQASKLGIEIREKDVQAIAVSLKDTFKTQAGIVKSINAALVRFQQQLNEWIEKDNNTTAQAIVFLRNQQNKKTAEYLQTVSTNVGADCEQWQSLAKFTEDLFGDVDLGENSKFDLGL